MKIFESLGYDFKQCERLNRHIDAALGAIDSSKINEEYRDALKKNERKRAVSALANYYRSRTESNIAAFGGGEYDRATAEAGAVGKVKVINIEHTFPRGKIDFLFNPTSEKLPLNHEWLWQLNRHNWWVDMARAYADTADEKYAAAFNTQLLDWIANTEIEKKWNEPWSAFRTIECGIRLMGSWQVAFNLFRTSGSVLDAALVAMLGSMYIQAIHLLNNPTRGNWLLMETSGIYNFGSLYGEFKEAQMLRSVATDRVVEEMGKQVLPDGLQFELSPDYHMVSFECVENIYKTAMACGNAGELPKTYLDYMYSMAMAAVRISTPGFTQPRTNDCYTITTDKFTRPAAEIFPQEPVFRFVNTRRCEGAPPAGDTASVFLPRSGFAVMRSDWSGDGAYMCFDVGPLGMAHMHQDKLNINLFLGDEELIFDDGGGQYEKSAMRSYACSAYDHNTVTVDGEGQNRREPKKTECDIDAGWITNDDFDYAYGIYDGEFGNGEKPAVHKRELRFCRPHFFVVRDTLTTADGNAHTYGIRFHLDTLNISRLDGGAVLADYGRKWNLLIVPLIDEGERAGKFEAFSGQSSPEIMGWFIGRNGECNHPATTIVMESEPAAVHHFTTLLIPFERGSEPPTVSHPADGYISVHISGKEYSVNVKELDK